MRATKNARVSPRVSRQEMTGIGVRIGSVVEQSLPCLLEGEDNETSSSEAEYGVHAMGGGSSLRGRSGGSTACTCASCGCRLGGGRGCGCGGRGGQSNADFETKVLGELEGIYEVISSAGTLHTGRCAADELLVGAEA